MCEPAALQLGPESTGHPGCKTSPKYSGGCLNLLYHHLCNDADGHTCHTWRDTMLRKSHGSSPEHTQIEGTGSRRIEYIHGHAEHKIPRWNKDSRRHLLQYRRVLNEQELGELTVKVRAQAKDTYERDLSLSQRIRYVQANLLAKIWHTVQVFPAPTTYTQQLPTAIAWYIWKGATFRVPISTLQKLKRQGAWGLIDIEAKCRALLIGRM